MKVLFIGGTGTISTACTAHAAEQGIDLYLLNRGNRDVDLPPGVQQITANVRNTDQAKQALADHRFDVVVDWIAFTPDHVQQTLNVLGHPDGNFHGQYVFISSASAYQKPVSHYPITESTPLANPWWEYSRNKIACEDLLLRKYRQGGLAMTIVRPSHTYGPTHVPAAVGASGWTIIHRIRSGKPVLVHGDGTSLWTLTHNTDFARAFVHLLGNRQAFGHALHITSDEWLTWDDIIREIGRAAGAKPDIIHIPSDFIAKVEPDAAGGLLGDKAWCAIFDNRKIKSFVPGWRAVTPFRRGVAEAVRWFDADPSRQVVNEQADARIDRIIQTYAHA